MVQKDTEEGRLYFVKYDVDTYYPDISASLFKKALGFGRKYVDISEKEEKVLWHARRVFTV